MFPVLEQKRSVVNGQCFQISQRLDSGQIPAPLPASLIASWTLRVSGGLVLPVTELERVNALNEVEMKCHRRWLVLVATRKDFMEGAVSGEGYLDV